MIHSKISLISCILFLAISLGAQAQEKFILNSLEPQNMQKSFDGETERIYYSLNENVFEHPEFVAGAKFTFSMSENEVKEFEVVKKKEYLPGIISIIAAEQGSRDNSFLFTYSDGRLNGELYTSHNESVLLKFDNAILKNYLTSNKETEEISLSCGIHEGDESLVTPPLKFNFAPKNKASSTTNKAANPLALRYASVDDSVTIDLMLVYTDAAETWALSLDNDFGDINGAISQAMLRSQAALDNSGTRVELRLVHTHKTSYNETTDGVDSQDRLRRLTQNPDNPIFDSDEGYDGYMEDIHDLRDQYGADIVSLLVKIEDTGGLGWRLSNTGGSPHFGFNLNRVQQIANGYTLIHEIGHNMGNAHARTQAVETAASEAGGLFHYSAGYQNENADFHTVMAYATTESGNNLTQAPIFSSPDITFQGVPAGTNDSQTPEDNARSMREIKGVVSSYRPSVVDAPSVSLSTNSIDVEMNREDELSVSFDISNSGQSGLMWNVDFDFLPLTVEKKSSKKDPRKTIEPLELENPTVNPSNYSVPEYRGKSNFTETVVYNTSFEAEDQFSTGTYLGVSGWRSRNNTEFNISSSNPLSGSQHLRVEYDGGDTKFIASPFFGYQLFGGYEVTINFYISDVSEVYDFYINDGKTGQFSSGVIIAQETIFAADLDENGGVSFFGTGATVSADVYNELRIIYNTTNESIDYYLNGGLITQNEYLQGFTPGLIRVLHRNNVLGSFIDVDDIEIKQLDSPNTWLAVPKVGGVTFEGETSEVGLTFNTEGLNAGTYETLLKVSTNDPDNRILEVPITLSVNEAVSNEITETPGEINLDQNYPNPFNPSTTIKYTLKEAQDVQLEVFNIQGQKVATLLNERVGAGRHQVTFDAANLSSGIYMYRLKTASKTLTRQMVLIK